MGGSRRPNRGDSLGLSCDRDGPITENVSFSVTEEEVQEYAQLFCRQEAHRLARHPEKIGQEEITEIYRRSLAPYVKADKS